MSALYRQLLEHITEQPVINTHCHQDPSLAAAGYNLDILFSNSYVQWCGIPWDSTPDGRATFLAQVRFNSYFAWTEKALQSLYQMDGPLTAQNWEGISQQLCQAHSQPGYWLGLLSGSCGYARLVQDSYWNPGDANGHPELFAPTFRVNAFFFGYHPEVRDHDGNNALHLYRQGEPLNELEAYLEFVRTHIQRKKRAGCVALKLPIAYDRGLDFEEVTEGQARAAFNRLRHLPASAEAVKIFQDYLFFDVCRLAAQLDLPLQVHTGMGRLQRSRAMWLQEAVRKNPGTRFVLLHCSFPWIDDTLALLRTYPNVYPDLAMLPLFSGEQTRRLLHELIEAGAAHKVGWGCDTWTPEESYGSLLALRHLLAQALEEKVTAGYLDLAAARQLADRILFANAAEVYRIPAPKGAPLIEDE